MTDFFWVLMGLGLIMYTLTGGADFGGGFWDLTARGPHKQAQRDAIAHAIGPIWEANHVWLIFVIVTMFTVFPRGFAALSIQMHVPLTAALVGIVLRGAAFTFRAYGLEPAHRQRWWGRIFATSSLVTPLFLGATLGGLAVGPAPAWSGWTSPFALLSGLFGLSLFAFLAATYLSVETEGTPVGQDFRQRALWAGLVAGVLSTLTYARASVDAPAFFSRLSGPGLVILIPTVISAASTLGALFIGRLRWARAGAVFTVTGAVLGFGFGMDRQIIQAVMPIDQAGAEPALWLPLLISLAIGGLLLVPSLVLLYRVFAGQKSAPH